MSKPIVKQIRQTTKKVKAYLKSDAKYREDDEVLVARYWYDELVEQKLAPGVMTGIGFLKAYAEGRLTPADIITRARRKAQEDDTSLQGEKWNQRHGMAEDVRQHINDNQFLKNV